MTSVNQVSPKIRLNFLLNKISAFLMLSVGLVHFIGFISLRKWFKFSGIESDTQYLEENYGYIYLIILNASAGILFIFLAFLYYRSVLTTNMIISNFIASLFIIRGVSGIVLTMLGITGSATVIMEILFSLLSLFIGTLGISRSQIND